MDISQDKLIDILSIKNKTKDEKELGELLASHYPDSISEPNFELKLKKLHFVKNELSEEKREKTEAVFSQKDSLRNEYSSCLPNYRDIFIFKRKDSIIGIAKVCFGCGITQFYGAKVDTDGFGLRTELDKLEKIIRE